MRTWQQTRGKDKAGHGVILMGWGWLILFLLRILERGFVKDSPFLGC